MTKAEAVHDIVITLIIVAGFAFSVLSIVSQAQETERLKFEKGYTQRYLTYGGRIWVASTDTVALKSPTFIPCR